MKIGESFQFVIVGEVTEITENSEGKTIQVRTKVDDGFWQYMTVRPAFIKEQVEV